MQRAETLTIEQIERFLAASEGVRLQALDREEIYSWVEGTLRAQQYEKQTKAVRGLLLRYLVKMTGLSCAQMDRLVRRFREHGQVKESGYRRHRFPQRYTRACAVGVGIGQLVEQDVSFAIQHLIAIQNRGLANGLGQVTFASAA